MVKLIYSAISWTLQERKKKNVLLLSTVQPLMEITDDEKKKPALYKLYDLSNGTEIADQKIGSYITKSKSRKWFLFRILLIQFD